MAQLELNRANYRNGAGSLTTSYLEFSYELAYLQIFGFWEDFLEQAFVRFMCGYSRAGGQEPLVGGGAKYSPTIPTATVSMLGGQKYVAWYVPSDVVGRCRKFFTASNFEAVIASATSILEQHRRIRHQIAHVQEHARVEFDKVTMSLTGRRYAGSRAGRFLRDDTLAPTTGQRWLATLASQLQNLSTQICS